MKKLLILLLLLPSLAWGSDLGQDYARMNPYILGGGASASYSCDPTSNEIGERSVLGTSTQRGKDTIHCIKQTADCTGVLTSAYAYSYTNSGSSVKVCIYADAGTVGEPDSSDTLLSCSGFIEDAAGGSWNTPSSMDTQAVVTNGTSYWMCFFPKTANWMSVSTTGDSNVYTDACVGCPDTPPSTLDAPGDGWSAPTDDRFISMYVTIGTGL